jgi:carbon starvation protein
VAGKIFPFLFITVMCGAISGFHALVSSGTTPKMIKKETDARTIGYGAMLIEGMVGVVAMIAAASLPTNDYYAMNTELANVPAFHERIVSVSGGSGIEHVADYERLTEESLRGRVGGAVTLAVGMAHILTGGAETGTHSSFVQKLWSYWYHFAIMFEALFILTTIDTGTRIGRFLLQEVAGKMIHPKFGQTDWWPGAIVSTALIVLGWAYFMNSGSFRSIWAMFGIANQMLAVIALAIVSVYLYNEGRARYLWVTVGPMIVVMTTTSTAAVQMLSGYVDTVITQVNNAPGVRNASTLANAAMTGSLIAAMLICTMIVIVAAAAKVLLGQGLSRVPQGFPVAQK